MFRGQCLVLISKMCRKCIASATPCWRTLPLQAVQNLQTGRTRQRWPAIDGSRHPSLGPALIVTDAREFQHQRERCTRIPTQLERCMRISTLLGLHEDSRERCTTTTEISRLHLTCCLILPRLVSLSKNHCVKKIVKLVCTVIDTSNHWFHGI